MNKLKSVVIFLLLISLSVFQPLFGDSNSHTPEPYNKEEFPQGLKDLRRFEIITLGSMPFVMLDCNMVYSGVLYAQGKTETFNPLNTQNYTSEQQVGLILTSLAISTGIGLTDYIVQVVKRNKKIKSNKKNQTDSVLVIPLEEDPDAILIENPQKSSEETQIDEVEVLN